MGTPHSSTTLRLTLSLAIATVQPHRSDDEGLSRANDEIPADAVDLLSPRDPDGVQADGFRVESSLASLLN